MTLRTSASCPNFAPGMVERSVRVRAPELFGNRKRGPIKQGPRKRKLQGEFFFCRFASPPTSHHLLELRRPQQHEQGRWTSASSQRCGYLRVSVSKGTYIFAMENVMLQQCSQEQIAQQALARSPAPQRGILLAAPLQVLSDTTFRACRCLRARETCSRGISVGFGGIRISQSTHEKRCTAVTA